MQYNYIRKLSGNLFAGLNWKLLIPACITGIIASLWVKLLNIPVVFSLGISFVLFFGSYMGILLLGKEPFVVEITDKAKKFLSKIQGKKRSHIANKPEMRNDMKRKNYYFKNIADSFINHWKVIIPFIILCTAALSVLGYQQANQLKNLTKEQQEEVDLYNEQLEAHDTQIEESQTNIEMIEEEISKLQKYIDESIYMKLEPLNIQVSTAQYAVTDTVNIGYVLTSMTNYLAYGNIQEILEKKYGETEASYIREVLSWPTNGNIINITINHYDKEQGKKILKTIQDGLESYIPEIVKVQGEFKFNKLESKYYVRADNDVTNVQNSKMDTLKNYNVSLADYNSRIASNKNAKADYIEENKPEVMEAAAPGNILIVKYAVFGIILGIVLPFVIISFHYLLSNRIRSAKELMNAEVPVFPCSKGKNGEKPDAGTGITELKLLARKYGTDRFFLNLLSGDDSVKGVAEDIKEAFEESGILVSAGVMAGEKNEALEDMVEDKYAVVIIKAGENTYPQLAKEIRTCQKFGIPLWGCIVVE